MLSPFQHVMIQKKQAAAGATRPVLASKNKNEFALRLLELKTDLDVLKNINSISDKISHKRDVLIPKWRPFIHAYLSGENHHDDHPIISTFIVWLFDVGEHGEFIILCERAIDKKIPTPEFIKRDWQTFCADSIYKWADEQVTLGLSFNPYFSIIFEKIQNGQWRLFEKISANFYKLAGQQLLRDENGEIKASHIGNIETLEKALALLTRADELNPKIGVGDLIKNRIPSRINALKTGTNL